MVAVDDELCDGVDECVGAVGGVGVAAVGLFADDGSEGLESCVRFVFVRAVWYLKCPTLEVPMCCQWR